MIYGIIIKFTDFYILYELEYSGHRCKKLISTARKYLREFKRCNISIRQLVVRLLHLLGHYPYFKSSFSVRDYLVDRILSSMHYDSIVEPCTK